MRSLLTESRGQLALFAFAALGLLWLVVDALLEKGVSDFNRLLALVIVIASACAYFRVGFPKGVGRANFAQPETQRNLLSFVFAIFAVISAAIGLMAPRAATESKAGLFEQLLVLILNNAQEMRANTEELKEGQEAIAEAVGAGEPSQIMQSLGGIWGEEGCAATYRFAVQGKALTVDSAKLPPGLKPMRWVFTVTGEGRAAGSTGEQASKIEAREEEGLLKGQSVTFTYASNGVTERLTWDGRDERQNTQHLVRCP